MLSHEDYKDVKSKMGGGMANKVKRVTNDSIKTPKSKALEKFRHYRQTEDGKKPAIYGRSVKGGGLNIKQLITPHHVLSYSHNKSRSNGEIGRKFEIKKREKTNL